MAKTATLEQIETTNKVYALREESKNDNELVKKLGITKATLYSKLKSNLWKVAEIAHINSLSK